MQVRLTLLIFNIFLALPLFANNPIPHRFSSPAELTTYIDEHKGAPITADIDIFIPPVDLTNWPLAQLHGAYLKVKNDEQLIKLAQSLPLLPQLFIYVQHASDENTRNFIQAETKSRTQQGQQFTCALNENMSLYPDDDEHEMQDDGRTWGQYIKDQNGMNDKISDVFSPYELMLMDKIAQSLTVRRLTHIGETLFGRTPTQMPTRPDRTILINRLQLMAKNSHLFNGAYKPYEPKYGPAFHWLFQNLQHEQQTQLMQKLAAIMQGGNQHHQYLTPACYTTFTTLHPSDLTWLLDMISCHFTNLHGNFGTLIPYFHTIAKDRVNRDNRISALVSHKPKTPFQLYHVRKWLFETSGLGHVAESFNGIKSPEDFFKTLQRHYASLPFLTDFNPREFDGIGAYIIKKVPVESQLRVMKALAMVIPPLKNYRTNDSDYLIHQDYFEAIINFLSDLLEAPVPDTAMEELVPYLINNSQSCLPGNFISNYHFAIVMGKTPFDITGYPAERRVELMIQGFKLCTANAKFTLRFTQGLIDALNALYENPQRFELLCRFFNHQNDINQLEKSDKNREALKQFCELATGQHEASLDKILNDDKRKERRAKLKTQRKNRRHNDQ